MVASMVPRSVAYGMPAQSDLKLQRKLSVHHGPRYRPLCTALVRFTSFNHHLKATTDYLPKRWAVPVAGNEYLDEAETAARSPKFMFDEITERVAKEPVRFRVAVQLAEDGDTVDDATVCWPEERPQLQFGEISLQEIVPGNAGEQRHIIFDPIPRVDGIEASADPLFEPRANVYLMSGRRRRAAGGQP